MDVQLLVFETSFTVQLPVGKWFVTKRELEEGNRLEGRL